MEIFFSVYDPAAPSDDRTQRPAKPQASDQPPKRAERTEDDVVCEEILLDAFADR
jgi:hypothetical protein